MNPRIARIVEVKPFLVTVEWTNGEVKSIDFDKFLMRERNVDSIFSKLFQKEIFSQVKTDGRTLYWDALTEMIDIDGSKIAAPIDFCPDVLYNSSK
ncbi:MAG: DUF2442 domain-containing protein [Cyclobacteriaceae bacterium]|nr:DUF2442 domain-containing protein [Cyclobacteriaceae bacterium]